MAQLYATMAHGDAITGTPSFADMEKADPKWKSSFSRQRLAEFNGALQEINSRAAAANVAPSEVVTQMDMDRLNKTNTGVAGYVKGLLHIRTQRNKGMRSEPSSILRTC